MASDTPSTMRSVMRSRAAHLDVARRLEAQQVAAVRTAYEARGEPRAGGPLRAQIPLRNLRRGSHRLAERHSDVMTIRRAGPTGVQVDLREHVEPVEAKPEGVCRPGSGVGHDPMLSTGAKSTEPGSRLETTDLEPGVGLDLTLVLGNADAQDGVEAADQEAVHEREPQAAVPEWPVLQGSARRGEPAPSPVRDDDGLDDLDLLSGRRSRAGRRAGRTDGSA